MLQVVGVLIILQPSLLLHFCQIKNTDVHRSCGRVADVAKLSVTLVQINVIVWSETGQDGKQSGVEQ